MKEICAGLAHNRFFKFRKLLQRVPCFHPKKSHLRRFRSSHSQSLRPSMGAFQTQPLRAKSKHLALIPRGTSVLLSTCTQFGIEIKWILVICLKRCFRMVLVSRFLAMLTRRYAEPSWRSQRRFSRSSNKRCVALAWGCGQLVFYRSSCPGWTILSK